MSALAADDEDKKKPGRQRSKRAPEPRPEPSSVHEGIEAVAAIESVEVTEIQPEPELAEQPEQVEPTEHPGEQGVAVWRTRHFGAIRVRTIDYSAGYVADHWCSQGHILFVLEGS